MAKRTSRVPAEWLFERARQIGDAAVSHVNAERQAVREKTDRLKAERLAKEASDGTTELENTNSAALKKSAQKRPKKSS